MLPLEEVRSDQLLYDFQLSTKSCNRLWWPRWELNFLAYLSICGLRALRTSDGRLLYSRADGLLFRGDEVKNVIGWSDALRGRVYGFFLPHIFVHANKFLINAYINVLLTF